MGDNAATGVLGAYGLHIVGLKACVDGATAGPQQQLAVKGLCFGLHQTGRAHAQHMALVACLADVIPLQDHYINAANEHIVEMARERQLAITADHPYVAEFWEVFEYLEAEGSSTDPDAATVLNHSRDPDVIAINLVAERTARLRHLIGAFSWDDNAS